VPEAGHFRAGAGSDRGAGRASGADLARIQWSAIIMPRFTSRKGMWQPTQPDLAAVAQGVVLGPSWHDRQTDS
jgi:hypothetical protein